MENILTLTGDPRQPPQNFGRMVASIGRGRTRPSRRPCSRRIWNRISLTSYSRSRPQRRPLTTVRGRPVTTSSTTPNVRSGIPMRASHLAAYPGTRSIARALRKGYSSLLGRKRFRPRPDNRRSRFLLYVYLRQMTHKWGCLSGNKTN